MRPSSASRPFSEPGALATASGPNPSAPPKAPRRRLETGVFAVESPQAILPQELSERVRLLAEPAIAATLFFPTRASAACSAIASATHLELLLTAPLLAWLAPLREVGIVEVPADLRRQLMCFRAFVLPIATPVLHVGSVALPDLGPQRHVVRQLETVVSDFALRLEKWQRDEVLRSFRHDSVWDTNRPRP